MILYELLEFWDLFLNSNMPFVDFHLWFGRRKRNAQDGLRKEKLFVDILNSVERLGI